jgi:hypothetical protein
VNSSASTSATTLGTSYKFDFDAGDFAIQDGKLVIASDYAAVKTWIEKILRTEKFKFKIYEKTDTADEYGITIKDLIFGNNYPVSFLKSELTREITETLTKNALIESVDSFVFTQSGGVLNATFNVTMTDGSIIESGV